MFAKKGKRQTPPTTRLQVAGVIEGPPGKNGKSAYQTALDNGFQGTEEEWLASLKGSDGEPGETGYTPVINLTEEADGVLVSIQNKDGQKTAKIKNGKDYEHSEEFSNLAQQVRDDKDTVEGLKTSVENSVTGFDQTVQNATESINVAGAGQVESIKNAGAQNIEKVSTEGIKQVQAVEAKGQEVLNSIPEDFPTQMATKLDKQQGADNAGKALIIGEDGNVVPGEAQSSGAGNTEQITNVPTTYELLPNKQVIWGEVAELNLTLAPEIPDVVNIYPFWFTSGITPTKLTLPANIDLDGLITYPNKKYCCQIEQNILFWKEYDVL